MFDDIRDQIVDLALDETELSPRELAVRFTDTKDYFVSEASVLYGRVRLAVLGQGLSQREVARRFGIDRGTVRKMLAHSVPPKILFLNFAKQSCDRRERLTLTTDARDQRAFLLLA